MRAIIPVTREQIKTACDEYDRTPGIIPAKGCGRDCAETNFRTGIAR
jgi:hypothetical protein